ncbi:MAG TPA: DUF2089 domain-containing protein [Fibrobacteria bacterium]|nr:DUF2089 domain-containing protein [Fibrobacteria bacterium]
MKSIDSNLACPSCQSLLQPKVLACPACDIKVEGPFQLNEFATLARDDLHFLRIFVRCEGRIRDMEAALGLSYPTIRARLSALKHKLTGEEPADAKAQGAGKPADPPDAGRILEKLRAGEIPFDEAMNQIKRLRANPERSDRI